MKVKTQPHSFSTNLVHDAAHAVDQVQLQHVSNLLIRLKPQSDVHADLHHAGHLPEERLGPLQQLFAVHVLEGLQILHHQMLRLGSSPPDTRLLPAYKSRRAGSLECQDALGEARGRFPPGVLSRAARFRAFLSFLLLLLARLPSRPLSLPWSCRANCSWAAGGWVRGGWVLGERAVRVVYWWCRRARSSQVKVPVGIIPPFLSRISLAPT